jgi:hypothetical protein
MINQIITKYYHWQQFKYKIVRSSIIELICFSLLKGSAAYPAYCQDENTDKLGAGLSYPTECSAGRSAALLGRRRWEELKRNTLRVWCEPLVYCLNESYSYSVGELESQARCIGRTPSWSLCAVAQAPPTWSVFFVSTPGGVRGRRSACCWIASSTMASAATNTISSRIIIIK